MYVYIYIYMYILYICIWIDRNKTKRHDVTEMMVSIGSDNPKESHFEVGE